MAAINIFDESTWKIDEEELRQKLNNKLIGAISNKIGDIRALKERIERQSGMADNVEYFAAQKIVENNPLALSCFGISYVFPDENVKTVLTNINYILQVWADTENRKNTCRDLLPYFQALRPYIDDKHYDIHSDAWQNCEKNINDLAKIKVNGNAAWNEYVKLLYNNKRLQDDIDRLRKDSQDARKAISQIMGYDEEDADYD